jgi:hypothetical protein
MGAAADARPARGIVGLVELDSAAAVDDAAPAAA